MDDIPVLAPTRWKDGNAVKAVNEVLGSLCLLKHPDKTFIGRIEKGFDLPLLKTVENFVARPLQRLLGRPTA